MRILALVVSVTMIFMENRGRFQAQGKKLEESESWAQNNPLYLDQGIDLLTGLKEKIPPFERGKRAKAFLECQKFLERASENGGITIVDKPVRKSFLRNETERVDLGIRRHPFNYNNVLVVTIQDRISQNQCTKAKSRHVSYSRILKFIEIGR